MHLSSSFSEKPDVGVCNTKTITKPWVWNGIPAKVPGDFYVNLQIVVPPADTAEAREAYATLKRVAGFNPRQHLGVEA